MLIVAYPFVRIVSGLAAMPVLIVGSLKSWPKISALTLSVGTPLVMIFMIVSVALNILITFLTGEHYPFLARTKTVLTRTLRSRTNLVDKSTG